MKLLTAFVQTIALLSLALTANSQSPTASLRTAPLAVGDIAPDFTLEDQNKNKVTLSDARAKSPVVLVFYRGYWSPNCARQLAELRTLLRKDKNVKLYAISVDPPEVSKDFAKKIASDGKGEINFPLLSDPKHKIIDAYGLRDPAYKGQKVYGIPRPTVYIIDKKGKAAWAKKMESDSGRAQSLSDLSAKFQVLLTEASNR